MPKTAGVSDAATADDEKASAAQNTTARVSALIRGACPGVVRQLMVPWLVLFGRVALPGTKSSLTTQGGPHLGQRAYAAPG